MKTTKTNVIILCQDGEYGDYIPGAKKMTQKELLGLARRRQEVDIKQKIGEPQNVQII